MLQNLVLIKAIYRGVNQDDQGTDPTEWLVWDHIPAFRRACPGFVNAYIIPDGAFIQVQLLVTADGWAAYRDSDLQKEIAADAKAHGFSSGTNMPVSYFISDDDGSPFGGNPESRSGNPEFERGFRGGERG